jgi:transposase
VHIARDHLADIRALDARIKYLGGQIAALVTASGTGLTGLFGVGPLIAGRLLAETRDVARFATKDAFASYNGTARSTPPPASRSATGSRGRGTGGSTTPCT